MNQFQISEKYAWLCDQKGADCNVRIYQNIYLATFDLVLSCLQYMSHKNKAAMIPWGACVSEVVSSICMKNLIPLNIKKENQNYLTFIDSLDSQTNFVLWTAENEITGEIYYNQKQCDEIHSLLNKKRIFSIQYVNQFRQPQMNFENSYSFYINHPGIFYNASMPTEVYFSNQQKMTFVIAPYQVIQPLTKKILFQNNLNDTTYDYFNKFSQYDKIKDRIVLLFDNTVALSIKQYFNLSSEEAFTPAELPSWVTDKWASWWPDGLKINLNNLLVLSPSLIEKDSLFLNKIQQAVEKISQESHWTIG